MQESKSSSDRPEVELEGYLQEEQEESEIDSTQIGSTSDDPKEIATPDLDKTVTEMLSGG